jgi:hypothetical protein
MKPYWRRQEIHMEYLRADTSWKAEEFFLLGYNAV